MWCASSTSRPFPSTEQGVKASKADLPVCREDIQICGVRLQPRVLSKHKAEIRQDLAELKERIWAEIWAETGDRDALGARIRQAVEVVAQPYTKHALDHKDEAAFAEDAAHLAGTEARSPALSGA